MTTHPWTTHPEQQTTFPHSDAATAILKHLGVAPARVVSWLATRYRCAVERADLRSLDEHLVCDLGPSLVREEAYKRFWMK